MPKRSKTLVGTGQLSATAAAPVSPEEFEKALRARIQKNRENPEIAYEHPIYLTWDPAEIQKYATFLEPKDGMPKDMTALHLACKYGYGNLAKRIDQQRCRTQGNSVTGEKKVNGPHCAQSQQRAQNLHSIMHSIVAGPTC